jgi:hypothetical protein
MIAHPPRRPGNRAKRSKAAFGSRAGGLPPERREFRQPPEGDHCMANYDVNIRAIVTATRADPNATGHIEGWEEYDFEALERDADEQPIVIQVRCDQIVSVEADNQEDAVENAKAEATDIVVEGYIIDDVTLWVDEGIDITLSGAENKAEAPAL